MAERILVSLLVLIVLVTVGVAVWLAVRPQPTPVVAHPQLQPQSITGTSITFDTPIRSGVAPGPGPGDYLMPRSPPEI